MCSLIRGGILPSPSAALGRLARVFPALHAGSLKGGVLNTCLKRGESKQAPDRAAFKRVEPRCPDATLTGGLEGCKVAFQGTGRDHVRQGRHAVMQDQQLVLECRG